MKILIKNHTAILYQTMIQADNTWNVKHTGFSPCKIACATLDRIELSKVLTDKVFLSS